MVKSAAVVVWTDKGLLTGIARNLLSPSSNNLLVFLAGISPNRNSICLVSRASWVAFDIGFC